MKDSADDAEIEDESAIFDLAVREAEEWGRTTGLMTGMWLNRRHRSIGVGMVSGDEIETTEALRALMPSGITIRTRVASLRVVELWQLQADVHTYLDVEHVWERWGASLEADPTRELLNVGLVAEAPEHIAAQIRERFPTSPVVVTTASRAIAL